MYMSRRNDRDYDIECIVKVDGFLDTAFGESAQGHSLVYCPRSRCDNKKMKGRDTMG
jgi:hypothetical protein